MNVIDFRQYSMPSRGLRPAFTMVELLVVIAIIAVLAALTFTMARRGIEAAQTTRCANNIRQVALNHVSIAGENNGEFVHTWKSQAFGSWSRNWADFHTIYSNDDFKWREKGALVHERMRTMDHLQCPTAAKLNREGMAEHTNHRGWRTYAINQRLGTIADAENTDFAWIDGASTTLQVQNPGEMMFVTERAWNGTQYPASFGPDNKQEFADFHGGRCHCAFMDGHVETRRREEIPSNGYQLPNGDTVSLGKAESSLIWRGRPQKRNKY